MRMAQQSHSTSLHNSPQSGKDVSRRRWAPPPYPRPSPKRSGERRHPRFPVVPANQRLPGQPTSGSPCGPVL